MNTEFFEPFETTRQLADYLAISPEFRGIPVGEFLQTHLPKESAFQAKIIKALRHWAATGAIDSKALIWKQSAGVYNRNGLPDVMTVLQGRLFAFEIKRPYIGRTTALQAETIRRLNQAGAVARMISYPSQARDAIIRAGLWQGKPV